ncbi:MAG: hypothetical protein WCI73_17730 [Phycisphaerae bacterium]
MATRNPIPPATTLPDDRLLVFVSSAMPRKRAPGIGRDRDAAVVAVSTMRDLFCVWTWEDCAFAGRFRPDDLYIKQAEKAHFLILIIHDRLTPNTKREYDASVKNHRGQMIFFREGFRLQSTARDFKRKLRDTTYWQYKNPSELKSSIIKSLRGNLLRCAEAGIPASVGTTIDYGRLGV